jgi:hypothetical protein
MEAIIRMIVDACPPESESILSDVVSQVSEYQAHPPQYQLPDGTPYHHNHGFLDWLQALHDGWGDLPEKLPHAFLLAWRNGSRNAVGAAPIVLYRCEGCRMLLPNSDSEGFLGRFRRCPVCGGTDIAGALLFKPGYFSLDGTSERAAA